MKRIALSLAFPCALAFSSPCLAQASPHPQGGGGSSVDWAAEKAKAEAQEAAYKAQTAAAEAQTAMIAAQTAATKASFGSVDGQTEITGEITPGEGTGKPEGMLLVSRSANAAAEAILEELRDELEKPPGKDILLVTSMSSLGTGDSIVFDLKIQEIETALDVAHKRYDYAKANEPGTKVVANFDRTGRSGAGAALTGVGAITDTLSKLGSYFQADYSFAAVDVQFEPMSLANSLAGQLRSEFKTRKVTFPDHYLATDSDFITKSMEKLTANYVRAFAEQSAAKSRAAALTEAKATAAATNYTQAEAAAGKALAMYESLLTTLTTPASAAGQEPFIVRLLKQRKAREALKATPLIILLDSKAAGQLYTKKSLWTFMGGPHLYTAGAVSVSYTMIDSSSGQVLAAGLVGKHGGYQRVRKVEQMFR